MIKLFEEFRKFPNVKDCSPEFWKMTRVANWKKVIDSSKKTQNGYKDKNEYDEVDKRLYTNYEYDQIKKFNSEYTYLYSDLYEWFEVVWLDKKYNKFMPSDDGYSDLISSVIGMGKKFTKDCIENPSVFIDMAKNDNYFENFGYLLQISKSEYIEIRSKYDPLFANTIKYNL